ncbi:MAG: carbohydrate binding domain-containing protein, partial [Clostridia bacterium]|nr:carbohydrate binding domain-containing protein [Clostridia bacterium]
MTKKLISSIMTISLILSLFVVPQAQAANLLKNSGFETGTGNWNVVNTAMWYVTGKDKVSGRRSLAVVGRDKEWATPQQFLNLQNGKTYTVSMWVKTAEGTHDLTVFVEPYRADGTKWPINICTVPVGEEWTHVQQTFTVKAQEPFTKIKILSKMAELTDLYFDDFEVWEGSAVGEAAATVTAQTATKAPQLPANPELENTAEADKTKINLLSNSDFEKGTSGYSAKNAELSLVDAVVSGNRALKVVSTEGAAVLTADADMRNAKEYNLNMWYKGSAVKVYTEGGTVVYEGKDVNDWTLVNETFVYSDSGKKPALLIEGYGEFYLDAVSLFEVPLVAENMGVSDNLIAAFDPGFETRTVNGAALGNSCFGNQNWLSRGTAKVSNAQAHTGTNSVEITSGTGPRAAVYGLTPGAKYYISVWVYPTQSGLKAELLLGGSTNARTSKLTLTANTWNQISGVVTAPAAGDAALNVTHGKSGNTIYLSPENLSAATYIDDFEIVPYELMSANTEDDGPVIVNPEGITSEGKDVAQTWDFHCSPSTPGLLAGWRVQVGNNNGTAYYPIKPEYQDGITRLDCSLQNGNMFTERYTNYNIDAEKYRYISIKAQNNTKSDTFRIAFWTTENPIDSKRIMYTVRWPRAEGMQEIILDMSGCKEWKGKIARIGWSPADKIAVDEYAWGIVGQNVLLESISVFADEPARVEEISGDVMTRADFVDMLVEKFELKNVLNSQTGFHDVGTGAPWHDSVMAAEETGIVSGNGAGYFNPADNITREHAAVMIKRACDYLDKQTDRVIPAVNFADLGEFSSGMSEAASFLANAGIMAAHSGGFFEPKGSITAVEADEIINCALDWINGTAKDGSVFVSADVAGTYDIVRMTVADPNGASYTNPYDLEEVKADAVFTAPDGSTLVLPGFYDVYSDYQYDPRRIPDEFSQDNTTYWKFRFAPTMAGEWKYEIKVTYDGNVTSLGSGKITAIDTGRPGFLKRDENNPRFIRENGDVFNAVGINLKAPV